MRNPRYINVLGKRFGRLVVRKLAGHKVFPTSSQELYECICDCGKTLVTMKASLLSGNTQSCGCLHSEVCSHNGEKRRIDLSGRRFGRLVAIEIDESRTRQSRKVYWKCRCDCGRTKVIPAGRLVRDTKSCGCLYREAVDRRYSDMTGMSFGSLRIVGRAGTSGGKSTWRCICTCGKESIVTGSNLRQGHTLGCCAK